MSTPAVVNPIDAGIAKSEVAPSSEQVTGTSAIDQGIQRSEGRDDSTEFYFDPQSSVNTGKPVFHYPVGQKEMPGHPMTSTDNQGNIYYQGKKVDPKIGIVFPTPGVGLPTTSAIAAAGTKGAGYAYEAMGGAPGITRFAVKGLATLLGLKLLGKIGVQMLPEGK